MDWTAFLLGLLTALSPCPLATNIAAVGFIGKDIEDRGKIFRNGLLYTLGRILAYTLLGVVLILILKEGSSMFGIQKVVGTWGELALGPLLLVIGLFMLVGDRLNLPQFGFSGNAEGLAKRGGWGALLIGVLFALAFCPTSGVFYFGMLIPLSASVTAGYLLPALFGAITPFCSCSSIPLFIGFVKGGIPLGVTFAFLITSSLVNEVAVAMFLGSFGLKVTLIYVVSGILLGVIGGFVLGRMRLAPYLSDWVKQIQAHSSAQADE